MIVDIVDGDRNMIKRFVEQFEDFQKKFAFQMSMRADLLAIDIGSDGQLTGGRIQGEVLLDFSMIVTNESIGIPLLNWKGMQTNQMMTDRRVFRYSNLR